jgi:hypothetical protein
MTTDELAQEVAGYIEEAIRENRRTETIIVGLLVSFAAVGLGIFIGGWITGHWLAMLPGVLCEVAIVWPIQKLISLRAENIRLLYLPQLIRMADKETKQKIVQQLAEALIKQVTT